MKDINNRFFKEKKEWSTVKDSLLGCYLKPYFQKVVRTNKYVTYIDCFSGKGEFEDGSTGSPLIALDNATNIIMTLPLQIKTIFIEKYHFEELESNVQKYKNANNIKVPSKIINGNYEDEILWQLQNCPDHTVFIYVDPYGIRSLNMKLFREILSMNLNSVELLINFNSFGFFREACRVMSISYAHEEALSDLSEIVEYDIQSVSSTDNSEELLTNIAGGDYWKNIVLRYKAKEIDGYEAERELSQQYKQKLGEIFKYILDFPIKLGATNRPKYRMVHASNHPEGCYLMATNIISRTKELFFAARNTKKTDWLLGLGDELADYKNDEDAEQASIEVRKFIDSLNTATDFKEFISRFYTKLGIICRLNTIIDELNRLEAGNLIRIVREPAKTKTGKPTRFWSVGKGNSITICPVKTCKNSI